MHIRSTNMHAHASRAVVMLFRHGTVRGVLKKIYTDTYVCIYIHINVRTHLDLDVQTHASRTVGVPLKHGTVRAAKQNIQMYEQIYKYALRIIPAGTRLSRCGHATQAWKEKPQGNQLLLNISVRYRAG
jgi:hypothetical protein